MTIATGAHWTAAQALPAALAEDQRCGLAFYGYPAEHWVHLRTTNPIESAFATVRHRSKITDSQLRAGTYIPGGRSRRSRPATSSSASSRSLARAARDCEWETVSAR